MAELSITSEQRNELLKAQSAQEARDFLVSIGLEPTAEEAELIWQEIERHEVDYSRDVSDDELVAVAGGYRNKDVEGCAATVEEGFSWCGSNDACVIFSVQYVDEYQKSRSMF